MAHGVVQHGFVRLVCNDGNTVVTTQVDNTPDFIVGKNLACRVVRGVQIKEGAVLERCFQGRAIKAEVVKQRDFSKADVSIGNEILQDAAPEGSKPGPLLSTEHHERKL